MFRTTFKQRKIVKLAVLYLLILVQIRILLSQLVIIHQFIILTVIRMEWIAVLLVIGATLVDKKKQTFAVPMVSLLLHLLVEDQSICTKYQSILTC